ncbi:MAG: hydantoinase/oxoprolinase family protein [Burkholderiales bacterium]
MDPATPIAIGVDIGGTFTDVVLVDETTGAIFSAKVLTTPDHPAEAVLSAIAQVLAAAKSDHSRVRTVVHGTTLATNAIIERKGARTALLTTRGFRDTLETGTELRYELYDLFIEFPAPLVPRERRIGITERMLFDGTVLTPLVESEVRTAARDLAADGVEAIAVCFLHSYANAANEDAAARAIEAESLGLSVSLSSRVLPEIGEYGRLSTTVANAYVQPLMSRYLAQLAGALKERGMKGAFFVMSSSGGTLSLDLAQQFPVRLVESGPAAGISIATHFANRLGRPNVLAFDMGGTTAKISLITGGQPTRTAELEVARVRRFQKGSGLLLKAPAVDLIEIGAGGGSIARVDALGLLGVGPDSAGADPGPACYGAGGTTATVTDADLALGYLNADYFLGGAMKLRAESAASAIEQHVAKPLGVSVTRAALSIYEVVNDNMANAASVYAAEQGIDLREYSMLAFGGAAPAHVCDVARRLGIREVRVPLAAGVLSALGCLASPVSFDYVFGYMRELKQVDWSSVNTRYAALEKEGRRYLAEAGIHDRISARYSADMRYLSQRYEVNVPLPDGPLGPALLERLHEDFYAAYRKHYGRDIREVPVETVSWRLTVSGPQPDLAVTWPGQDAKQSPLKGRRPVVFQGSNEPVDCAVYERSSMTPGTRISGPAIIEDRESTAVVPPDAHAEVDALRMLVITLKG